MQPELADQVAGMIKVKDQDEILRLLNYDSSTHTQFQHTEGSKQLLRHTLQKTLRALRIEIDCPHRKRPIPQYPSIGPAPPLDTRNPTPPSLTNPTYTQATIADSVICCQEVKPDNDNTHLGIDGHVDAIRGRKFSNGDWPLHQTVDICYVHCAGNDIKNPLTKKKERGNSE